MTQFTSKQTLTAAQQHQMGHFRLITFGNLISQDRKRIRYQLIANIIHSSKSTKKMKTRKPKNGGGVMTDSPISHRLIICPYRKFNVFCFASPRAHIKLKKKVYWPPQLYPGCAVHVIKTRVLSFVEDIQSFPPAVHIFKADFGGFEFVFKSVCLISAFPVDVVCFGSFWTHNPS